jgi:hypothetical protein
VHEWAQLRGQDKFTFSLQLSEEISIKSILEMISRLSIDPQQYGIWVSLTSSYDNGGVSVPEYISKLYKEIGGKLDFSYVIINDTDDNAVT